MNIIIIFILVIKQTFYQIYSLIFGLDMLGNPVSVVKGVAGGAIDLFYEPYKVYSACKSVCIQYTHHMNMHTHTLGST